MCFPEAYIHIVWDDLNEIDSKFKSLLKPKSSHSGVFQWHLLVLLYGNKDQTDVRTAVVC
jgi:hypothetical protein